MDSSILFVGSTDHSLSDVATKFNTSARIVTKENLTNYHIGYISLGDHLIDDFVNALTIADEIVYVPPDSWGDDSTKLYTEFWLRYFSHKKSVKNFSTSIDIGNILELVDTRKTVDSQIWVAGCSYTAGFGVEHDQRYGHRLGEYLNKPVSYLAQGGSSITWAADQILRSDIRSSDIIVWGLTGISRLPYYDQQVKHLHSKSVENTLINEKILVSDHMKYLACTAIEQVIQQANTIGYKLILTQFPLNIWEHEQFMLNYLSQYRFFIHNYISTDDTYIDHGSDNEHPGPKQHEHYAKLIMDYLNNENLS